MERKIGEIFEYNGEWCQCVGTDDYNCCKHCVFHNKEYDLCDDDSPQCLDYKRADGKNVIFKKLDKVGEPYFNGQYGEVLQEYKYYIPPITPDLRIHIIKLGIVGIEIKQNKEDMEEKKLSLKPFDLQKAKEGKPVCTRDGRKARIICFDRDWDMHIVALVSDPLGESVHYYLSNGKVDFDKQNGEDLMMLPEKRIGWINVNKDASLFKSKEEAERDCTKNYVPVRVEFEI